VSGFSLCGLLEALATPPGTKVVAPPRIELVAAQNLLPSWVPEVTKMWGGFGVGRHKRGWGRVASGGESGLNNI